MFNRASNAIAEQAVGNVYVGGGLDRSAKWGRPILMDCCLPRAKAQSKDCDADDPHYFAFAQAH